MAVALSEQVAKIRAVGTRWRLPLALGAAASYGLANVMAKRLTLVYGSPLVITAFGLLFGILLLAPFAGTQAVQSVKTAGGDLKFTGFASLSGLASALAVCWQRTANQSPSDPVQRRGSRYGGR